ncbi:MAG: Cysteine desulfurase [bacterium ADurb.Bin243]|nr:MAG: Cysteine desulfurase [bacterium ADurb.Bin243]HOD39216.1 cysteine desulfurase family protein [Candidatus Wallbacteria bacterium]
MKDEKKIIYFDNNSTTRPLKALRGRGCEYFANASSYHWPGLKSRFALETAREKVAAFIGARPSEIFFTSSGSEANNMAVGGVINQFKYFAGLDNISVIMSAVEHHSILNISHNPAFKGVEFKIAPVDANGVVDLLALERLITPSTVLVSVMMANNETGAVMPFEKIGGLCAEKSVLFHCDAVCASAKIKYDVSKFNCDLLTVSAHKMYGPKGAACLYKKRGVTLTPLIYGGHQENDLRAGTENLDAIDGFALACEEAGRNFGANNRRYLELKTAFLASLKAKMPGVKINGAGAETLANTVSLSFDFKDEHESNAFMFNLDMMGLAVSRGAACASSANAPSHALAAMGLDPLMAASAVRVSFGIENEISETEEAVNIIRAAFDLVASARKA